MRDNIRSPKPPSKPTSRKTSFQSKRVDNVYPDHANDLHEASLASPISLKMGELWKGQDGKMNLDKEKYPEVNKNKNRNVYLCVSYSY